MPDASLETIRQAETGVVRPFFRAGSRVLEIGGGSGFQAKIIESWGCPTLSIDIASREFAPSRFHPVASYDGVNIPARTHSVDIVFSSNVLEHVKNLDDLFREMNRVVKPGGMLVHVLPSTSWRFWTNAAHYVFLLKVAMGMRRSAAAVDVEAVARRARKKGLLHMVHRALWPGPHGEYPNALAELWYFSRRRWQSVFESHGFLVEQAMPSGIYNSGYVVFPRITIAARRWLSKVLGSSTTVFVLRPRL